MGHAFISPLNWGLGHATRDIPIIRELLRHGHEVTIATSGNALIALKREFPDCNFILFKDYPAPYSSTRFFLPKFTANLPLLMKALADERKRLKNEILSKNNFDIIISDNRMGVFSEDVPSYFITHQLRFSLPGYLYPLELLTLYVNGLFHTRYEGILVPDVEPNGHSLSGKLAYSNVDTTIAKSHYCGILTSTEKINVDQDLDYLIIVSGPEPQRSKLEEIILKQAHKLPGDKVILLGSPQRERHERLDQHTIIHSYVSTEEKVELMNRAKFVVSRSGYTTMMELAELDMRYGLLTPTPGQTEQEYLSRYYAKQGWFYSRSQYKLKFPQDMDKAMEFKGFPKMPKTEENVKKLYQKILKKHLN
jgi:UDP:flavonoid glycosyltransferase YjiC (YdhE family)